MTVSDVPVSKLPQGLWFCCSEARQCLCCQVSSRSLQQGFWGTLADSALCPSSTAAKERLIMQDACLLLLTVCSFVSAGG